MLKRLLKCFLLLPIVYLLVAIAASYIPYPTTYSVTTEQKIYISTNGVHVDIILPNKYVSESLQQKLSSQKFSYTSFGWGDKNFYLNTPEWKDLKVSTAFNALFCKSESLMHIDYFHKTKRDWIAVKISQEGLVQLNRYLEASFQQNQKGQFIPIPDAHYSQNDVFYQALGSYSFYFTCNTWVNKGLKQSGIPTSLWTLFDFGILYHLCNQEDNEM